MKKIQILSVAVAVGLSAVAGMTGCSTGDKYHESTGQYIDDSTLTEHVKHALDEDYYKYPDVKVTTFKGVVQLSGFVDNQAQKDRAAVIAKSVQGVVNVENNISLKAA